MFGIEFVQVDMADEWVHVMFGVNYDDNYDTVINHIIDHINCSGTDDSGGVASNENECGNEGVDDGGDDGDDSSGTNDDDDDNDENEDLDCTDDNDESFWLQEFDRKKLLLCTTGALYMYFASYVHKEPCMVSYNKGTR